LLERLRSAKDHIEITIDAEDYYRIKDFEKKQDEYEQRQIKKNDNTN
jgi:hypothetical protein